MDEKENDFVPIPFFSGQHGQTILASLVRFDPWLRSECHVFSLPDEDQLAMEVSTPPGWQETDPTVLMVHGLCGSHKSSNVVRIAKKIYDGGSRAIRLNLRGCGSGKGLARKLYHCGCSEDVLHAIEEVKRLSPNSPLYLIGFSLGANLVLKLLGELGDKAKDLIEYAIAISPPADLRRTVQMIQQESNQIYERYFIRLLLNDIDYRKKRFPDLPQVNLHPWLTVFEFDEYYIAPTMGFASAFEYYDKCSGKHFVPNIKIPLDILFARDDPIIDADCIDDVEIPENVKIHKTCAGGHLGFIGHPKEGFRWMDRLVMDWLSSHMKPKEK